MSRTPTINTPNTAEPKNWAGIGDYLRRENVQLITNQQRKSLLESWEDITQQEENLDDALLIGLVGGTGVGKSTFINAWAGQEVSRSSDRRPTTNRVIVYRYVNTEISGDVPTADFAQPQVLHDNSALEKIVLFDFPDFDSAEESHTHIIRRYLPFLDVLFVVVDDVKYADRRLYELLAKLDQDPNNVFVLLNKVDRLQGRYGDNAEWVITDLLADLDQKLKDNSHLHLKPTQMFPIAALPVYEARLRREPTPAFELFSRVENVLESFQVEKHRRAAKDRNIDARKRDLAGSLVSTALGKKNQTILVQTKSLVRRWQAELDQAIGTVPIEILSESERRGVSGSRLRLVGPRWGVPFSLFFTLIGEIRRRSSTVEPSELGQRVMSHYRSFFAAIKNVRARFTSEFSGSKINLSSLSSNQSLSEPITATPNELADSLYGAVQQTDLKVPRGRRWFAHVPGAAVLCVAFWGKIHPILESAMGTGQSGVVWTSLMSLVGALNPTFIIGTILGVLLVYLLSALMIWLREIQKLDYEITTAEQQTREVVRTCGQQAVDQLDGDVRGLYQEFEQLEALLGQHQYRSP